MPIHYGENKTDVPQVHLDNLAAAAVNGQQPAMQTAMEHLTAAVTTVGDLSARLEHRLEPIRLHRPRPTPDPGREDDKPMSDLPRAVREQARRLEDIADAVVHLLEDLEV